ncbi:AAA family ATPase [Alicyclobacillus tolerans]|uniref:AAA family ATPase n=1 Tax=Alicyclobacillus tolerans TaxID=90970 RepID=UPI001F3185C6|nr:AAA family ATPase [Alicyclobacillus tolerans]MCF8568011.1 AAA family ATPase [Alicyclobacillus tolerans]
MKLVKLAVENFRCFAQEEFHFEDQTVIRAMNAQGKSTLAEAVVWCLYGTDVRGKSKMDMELMFNGAKSMRVMTQWITQSGDVMAVDRMKPEKGATRLLVNGTKAAPGLLEGLFFPYVNEFLSVFLPGYFSSLEPKEAKTIVARYSEVTPEEVMEKLMAHEQKAFAGHKFAMGYDSVEFFRANVSKELKAEQEERLRVEGQVQAAEETIQAGPPETPVPVVQPEHRQKANTYREYIEKGKQRKTLEQRLEELQKQKDVIHNTYQVVQATLMALNESCPVCGQGLDERGKKRAKLNLHAHNAPIEHQLKELEKQENALDEKVTQVEQALAQIRRLSPEDILKCQNYVERVDAALKKEQEEQTRYQVQLEAYEKAKNELEQRRTWLGQQETLIANLQTQLDAVKVYRMRYVQVQQAKLDALFDKVKIVLSKVNEDGELKDAFQITWNGKFYRTLSTSEKVRCDLEIGRAIAALNKPEPMPVFVDNAEGVQNLFQEHLDRQTIAAYVFDSQLLVQTRDEAVQDLTAELRQLSALINDKPSVKKGA